MNADYWTNTTKVIESNLKKEKPCKKLGYCPYGSIVECFPFTDKKLSCPVFGHDCPMYYNAEDLSAFGKKAIRRVKKNDLGSSK